MYIPIEYWTVGIKLNQFFMILRLTVDIIKTRRIHIFTKKNNILIIIAQTTKLYYKRVRFFFAVIIIHYVNKYDIYNK